MSEAITTFPLTWPAGWKRTSADSRKRANFNKGVLQTSTSGSSWKRKTELSVADAVRRVLQELHSFGIEDWNVIISTNVEPRLDGLPRSGKEAQDPGVAVYWTTGKGQKCMAIDRYDRVADNLAAVAATIYAMRAIERHGGAEILERAFLGFQALPAPMEGGRPWQEVLQFPDARIVNRADAEARYRVLAKEVHPDNGGDPAKMAELNEAIRQAREILK